MAKWLTGTGPVSGERKTAADRSGFWSGFFLLTLISVGAGALVAVQSVQITKENLSEEYRRARNHPVLELTYDTSARLRKLDPVVTNLAAPKDAWVRVQASIVLSDEYEGDLSVLKGRIEEDILSYVRTLSISHLEGAVGLQHLREDLNDRAQLRSDGEVVEVIVESLVIQ
ncbi:flagellar basal body-associated FliL family protein [Roseibium sp. RKSG952]|uniref:flagellar basal body-associated FliL family protein n=1 Tax=Roseibium sp. RKSG952 TaxID=2529384 RepID=UPI0012BCBF8D|nr:flagellar basal body-associated FliL family protein [Roseibium sp. RKSG952]MTH96619.1 flagellar basal body-associated FliL family protein [Roseibium sp. RKSG952]